MKVNNPVHELETNEANRKDNPRVLVDVGRTNAEDSFNAAIILAHPGEARKVRVCGRRQTLVAPVKIDEGCCSSRGCSRSAFLLRLWQSSRAVGWRQAAKVCLERSFRLLLLQVGVALRLVMMMLVVCKRGLVRAKARWRRLRRRAALDCLRLWRLAVLVVVVVLVLVVVEVARQSAARHLKGGLLGLRALTLEGAAVCLSELWLRAASRAAGTIANSA